MKNSINISWQQIIKLSKDLLEMAKSSRWEDMPEITIQRDELIRSFFNNNPASSSNAKNRQASLIGLLNIDKEIMALTNIARSNLNGKMSAIAKGANATHAYNSCP